MTVAIPEGRKTPLVMQVDFSDSDLMMKLPGAVVGHVKSADPQPLGNGTYKGKYHQQGVSLEQDLMKYIRRAGADKMRLATLLEIIDKYLKIEAKPGQADLVESLKRGNVRNPLTTPVPPDPWDEGPLYDTTKPKPRKGDFPFKDKFLYDWSAHEWEEPMTSVAIYPYMIRGKSMPGVVKAMTERIWRTNSDAAAMFFAEVQEWVFECEQPSWEELMMLLSQYVYLVPHGDESSSSIDPHRPPF